MCFYKGSECNTLYFVSRNTSVQHAPTKRGLFIQPVLKREHSPFCFGWCGGHKEKDASGKICTYNTNHSKQCVTSLCQWTLTKTSYYHIISMPKETGEWINNEWFLFGVLHSCSSNRKELCNKRPQKRGMKQQNPQCHEAGDKFYCQIAGPPLLFQGPGLVLPEFRFPGNGQKSTANANNGV